MQNYLKIPVVYGIFKSVFIQPNSELNHAEINIQTSVFLVTLLWRELSYMEKYTIKSKVSSSVINVTVSVYLCVPSHLNA